MANKGIEEICPYCGFNPKKYKEDTMVLPLHTVLNNRYLIGKSIGSGGFGITYLAWDQTLEVAMAIKEYLPSNLAVRKKDDKSVKPNHEKSEKSFHYYMDKFLEEARMLAQFNDEKGIVSVQDVFKENGTIYIVMYYINGIDLEKYLMEKGGKLHPREALKIMRIVMDSLSKVHDNGLIHRDISPDNIYITSDKQVKLLDFGASRYTIGEGEKTLSVIMKRGYAPLEQYTAKGKQGPWTDVYSAAATLYKLMTGSKPEEPLDRMDVDLLKSPKALGVSIDFHVDIAIMKALELRPENRYQTIKAFLEGLEGHEPVVVPVKEAFKTETKSKKKMKKRTLFLGLLAFVLMVGMAYGMIAMNPKVPQETANEPDQDLSENFEEETPEPREASNEIKLGLEEEKSQDEMYILEYTIGMDYLEVFNLLNRHGIELVIKEEQYHESHGQGVVIHQSLASGTQLKKGDQVQVILSKGSEFINIPVLKGQTVGSILKLSEESDFILEIESIETDAYEPGTIMSQSPDTTKITRGTRLLVQVAEAVTEPVDLSKNDPKPDLTGAPVEESQTPDIKTETEIVATEPVEEAPQNPKSETQVQEISQDNRRIIKDWLVQIPTSDGGGFQTRVIKDKLPDHLKEVDFITVWGHDNITPSYVQYLLSGPIQVYDFHEYKKDYMTYNSSGNYYNYHLIVMGIDDTIMMYAAVYPDGSVEYNDQVKIPVYQQEDLSPDDGTLQNELLNKSELVFKTGDGIKTDAGVQSDDNERTLALGIVQNPNYYDYSFSTEVIRSHLPASLASVNQISVSSYSGSIDGYINYIYEYLKKGQNSGINPSLNFNSVGGYYHTHMVALFENYVLKAVVKVAQDGTITYKYL
jgi:serine/threonine protein kinase